MSHTFASVMDHHGIAPTMARNTERYAAADEAGIVSACLGCGSVVGFNADGMDGAARMAHRAELIAMTGDAFTTCCPGATMILI